MTDLSWRKVALVVAAAFAVKLVVPMQLSNHPLLQPHGELDTAYYVALKPASRHGRSVGAHWAFFVSPFYVYFLAAVFAAGGSLLAAQLVQIALGAVAVGLLFATARHWFGERAALVAAGLAILTGVFTFNEVLILQSALDPFLVSCALYALTRTRQVEARAPLPQPGRHLDCSRSIDPTRSCLLWQRRVTSGMRGVVAVWRDGRVKRGAVLVTALLAVLAASAARNYAVSGDVVLIASHGGLNLYIGNHDRADGTYTPVPGITPSIAGQAGDSTRVAESRPGRRLSPGEVSSYFAWRAFDWVAGHPADALRLWIRKIGILLNRVDVPLNYSYAFYAREPPLSFAFWPSVPGCFCRLAWSACSGRRCARTATGIGCGRCSSRCTEQRWSSSS